MAVSRKWAHRKCAAKPDRSGVVSRKPVVPPTGFHMLRGGGDVRKNRAAIGVGKTEMWLFTGRYAQYGPAICVIALGVLSMGVIFLVIAVRLAQRRDVACVLITATLAAAFNESQAFGEPVFVSNSLNPRTALFLAVVGILLGTGGVVLLIKLRLLRVLILVAASAILFGDVAGWIRRSAGPSKYDAGGSASAPLWRNSRLYRRCVAE
jgi:hypothetical protein